MVTQKFFSLILLISMTISECFFWWDYEKCKNGTVIFHSLATRKHPQVFLILFWGVSLAPTFLSLVESAKFFLVLIINVTCLCTSYPANH